MDAPSLVDNPFALLSLLVAPGILTNASTLLTLSTSNRLARAADRARQAHTEILASTVVNEKTAILRSEFESASRRASLLVRALSNYYLAVGSFAAATCIALLGAFAGYFRLPGLPLAAMIGTSLAAMTGVAGLVLGSAKLVAETRLALKGISELHASITRWRATHDAAPPPPSA